MTRFPILLAAALSACAADETVTAFTDVTRFAADGAPLTLILSPGRVAAQTPCLSLTARQTAPYPWWSLSDAKTDRLCAPSPSETETLRSLAAMTLVEVSGPVLLLTGPGGTSLSFTAVTGSGPTGPAPRAGAGPQAPAPAARLGTSPSGATPR